MLGGGIEWPFDGLEGQAPALGPVDVHGHARLQRQLAREPARDRHREAMPDEHNLHDVRAPTEGGGHGAKTT